VSKWKGVRGQGDSGRFREHTEEGAARMACGAIPANMIEGIREAAPDRRAGGTREDGVRFGFPSMVYLVDPDVAREHVALVLRKDAEEQQLDVVALVDEEELLVVPAG
jgi:hypothetical protein